MSKKKRNSKKKPKWTPPNVAAAMRAANQRGSYGASIAAREIARQFGEATLALHRKPAKKKRASLSKAEKAARARVRAARASYASSAARAARLPGKKKRTSKKKVARASAPAQTRRQTSKLPTTTADKVIADAAKKQLRRWLCEGARRSGCGAGGSRVISGKGSFVRIRPPRFMTTG